MADALDGLTRAQRDAVTDPARLLAVVAGPGSGKTRVLTARIAWRCREDGAVPARCLALTFSRRAASELLGRLARSGLPAGARDGGVVAGTFHAVAYAQLARHHADNGQSPPTVTGRPRRLLTAALARTKGRAPKPGEVASLAGALSRARARLLTPADCPDLADAWDAYEHVKQDRRVMDLDDLLARATTLISDDPDARAVAAWRHRHVFVDEYQDLNPAHVAFLRAVLAGRDDLCLVGDPDQAVYGFNGAEADLFDRVQDDWPGVRIRVLDANFRSSPEIARAAAALRPASPRSARGAGALPAVGSYVDAQHEADAIACEIAMRRGGSGAWRGVAVLARTNARLRLVAASLDRMGIPWRLRDPRPLADRPSVQEWVSDLPSGAPAADLGPALEPFAAAGDADARALAIALREFRVVSPRATVAGFGSWLDAAGVLAAEAAQPGVDLATYHRAKGLEWASVWVAAVDELSESAEDERLLYVALTRAEDELRISWAGEQPPVCNRVVAACAAMRATPAPPEQLARLSALRLVVRPPADDRRRPALEAWRTARARAAGVVPAVVLPDAVIEGLLALPGPSITTADVVRIAGPAAPRAALWASELLGLLAAS